MTLRKFAELGTLGGLVRYLAHHQIHLGVRVRQGPGKGELTWRRIFPCCGLLQPSPMPIAKGSFARLAKRVGVDIQGNSERVRVHIEWIGGGHTEGFVIRPVGKLSELSTYPQICQPVQELTEAGWADTAIAQALSDASYCSAHAPARFGAQTVREVQRRLGVRTPRPPIVPPARH